MKIVIIGNGISGITAAKTIREKDKSLQVEIYTDEKYHFYPRPMLIDFLSGNKTEDELFFYKPDWYEKNNIKVKLNVSAKNIDLKSKKVIFDNGDEVSYDKLLIATGAASNLPPIKGSDKQNVWSLRCLDDAKVILENLKNLKNLVIIGGGILGLEIANALKRNGLTITVIEVAKYLLPRQLDEEGGEFIKKLIEEIDIKIICAASIEEISGDTIPKEIKFKNGSSIPADGIIISAGIKPNIAVAVNSGIKTNKGIIVNEFLETSEENIYAAGDVAEFNGTVYGIIPAAIEQSKVAAENMLYPRSSTYKGTIISNTLKLLGIDLTTEGSIYDKETVQYKNTDLLRKIYKKLFLKDNRIIGIICLGDKKNLKEISELIKSQKILTEQEIKKILNTT